jgi:hypothetical protein
MLVINSPKSTCQQQIERNTFLHGLSIHNPNLSGIAILVDKSAN